MAVRTLDHVNIRTADVPGTTTFFRDVMGLEARTAPGAAHIDQGCWIHDPAGHPIIHIGPVNAAYPSDDAMPFTAARGSGAVHHVALECDDLADMLDRLARAGQSIVRKNYDEAKLVQLFVEEANGIILELNFPVRSDLMLSTDLVLSAPPFDHLPLIDRLAPARNAGFSAVSLMPGDVWALEQQGMAADDIRKQVVDHGLGIREIDCTACWLPAHRAAGDNVPMAALLRSLTPEQVIETAVRIGAPSVTAVEMMGVTPSLDEAAEAFASVCDYAAERGINVHIEFLPFGGIPDLASAWAIVQAAGRPNGGLTVDSWHFFRSRSSLDLLAAIPGERIHTVQINDAPAEAEDDLMRETMAARLLPGTGSFDLTGFIRTLDGTGCTAPVSVEIFSRDLADQPMAEAIRDWVGAAGEIIRKARSET